jgi:hypothetical protein
MPCAAASPVVANKAAAATETRKLFFMVISSCKCDWCSRNHCPTTNAA